MVFSQALRVEARLEKFRLAPCWVYVPKKVLQPAKPLTLPVSKVMLWVAPNCHVFSRGELAKLEVKSKAAAKKNDFMLLFLRSIALKTCAKSKIALIEGLSSP